MSHVAFVYILASQRNGTLYVGATSNLVRRVEQHRSGVARGFTCTYAVHTLVWFERFDSIETARVRERQLKKWRRVWKLDLIEKRNPTWRDLSDEIPW